MKKENDFVEDLTLYLDDGSVKKLSDFKHKKLVIYFYPRDNTPGCTSEACSINASIPLFEAQDVAVIGVSPDSIKKHVKFKEKHHLNFPLASDENLKLAEAFGVWQEKSLYGKKYMGIVRTTFVLNENLQIIKVYDKVKVRAHGEQILLDF